MENHLALRLKNVHYYIMDGSYSWAGELVIANRFIYYFPVRDLMEERERTSAVGGLIGLLQLKVIDFLGRNKSYLEEQNLINSDADEETLQPKLDRHLAEIKQEKNDQFFSYTNNSNRNKLPSPIRFEADDIQNIILDSKRLHFETVADKHDFKLAKSRTLEVHNALTKQGFVVSNKGK